VAEEQGQHFSSRFAKQRCGQIALLLIRTHLRYDCT
jgi:hypothetical protein